METDIDITTLKPSELLKLALDDLTKLENHPNYKIDMMDWVFIDKENKICSACLGGAVMINQYSDEVADQLSDTASTTPNCLNDGNPTTLTSERIVALDFARRYDWYGFFSSFTTDHDTENRALTRLDKIEEISYHTDPFIFKNQMNGAIKILEEEGI